MMHLERYEKHAILEYYFEGGFDGDLEGCSAEVEAVIEDYLYRTSYHFRQEGVRLMHGSWERKVLKPRMPKDDLSSKVQVFDPVKHKKYIVYNGSPRGKKGNSLRIANQIILGLKEAGISDGNIELRHLIHQDQHMAWAQNFSEAASHIFVLPLYVHSMPGIVKKYFDLLSPYDRDDLYRPQMSFFVQSGFMGTFQSQYLRAYLARLPERLNCFYGGTLIRAGMESLQMTPDEANKKLFNNLRLMGKSIVEEGKISDGSMQRLESSTHLPLSIKLLYPILKPTGLTNFYWNMQLKKNGAYEQRFDKPWMNT